MTTTTNPREILLARVQRNLKLTYHGADEDVLDVVAMTYLAQMTDDEVLVRISDGPIRSADVIDKVLASRHLVLNREFRSVESIVTNDNCVVQIGYMTNDRVARFSSSRDRLDAICSCGWEFDFFKESLDEAEYSAQLHVDNPNDVDDDLNPLQEDALLAEYGRYHA